MSKDDYFVLAYKLLRYLYRCLKEGTPASWDIIAPNTENFPVSQQYFTYLISHLLADGYIEGIVEMKAIGAPVQFKETTGLAITPKGIAYLEELDHEACAGVSGPGGRDCQHGDLPVCVKPCRS